MDEKIECYIDTKVNLRQFLKILELTCDLCGAIVTRKDHLRRHKRTHYNNIKYPCKHCHKIFRRRDILTRHNLLFHSSLKLERCKNCKRKSSLKCFCIK